MNIVVAFCGVVIYLASVSIAYSHGYRAALRWAQGLLEGEIK